MTDYGYARVSRASDDEVHNLDTQRQALLQFGIPNRLIFNDVATGARFKDRTGWQELRDELHPGDNIIITHLDRFSRNMREGLDVLKELSDANVGIYAINTGFDTRAENAAAQLIRNIILAFAEWQYSDTRERVMAGMERARGQGRMAGKPSKKTPENIRAVMAMHRDGASIRGIAAVVEGVSKSLVQQIIKEHEETEGKT